MRDALNRSEDHEILKSQVNLSKNKFFRAVLSFIGLSSVVLGIIGIFLPVIPTTPFFLLAAACFARSSEKFYVWLLTNKYCGTYLQNYRNGKGIPLKVKIATLIILWGVILSSILFFVTSTHLKYFLFFIACAVTCHLYLLRTMTITETI